MSTEWRMSRSRIKHRHMATACFTITYTGHQEKHQEKLGCYHFSSGLFCCDFYITTHF